MTEISATEWFDYLQRSAWVSLGPNRLVQAQRSEGGIWTIGDVTTTDEDLLKACPVADNISDIFEFHLIHQGWRAAAFRLYRPVAYFCAFHAPEIFGCVEIAIKALIEFGKWQHEIVVLTEEASQETLISKLTPLGLGDRLHIVFYPAQDQLDWCLARYKLDHSPVLQQAQPLIYFDADTVCNKPLDTLLIELIASPYVHACREGRVGEGSPESDGHWYGWRLMAEDNVPFNPNDRGFSAGMLAYANARTVAEPFDLIFKSAYGYVATHGNRDRLASFDQKFANYVLRKLNRFENDTLAQWINLYRIPPAGRPFPDPNHRLGVVHFLGASLAVKLAAMRDYFEALQQTKPSDTSRFSYAMNTSLS